MSLCKRKWPCIREYWFNQDFRVEQQDIALLYQYEKVPEQSFSKEEKHTLVIDLKENEEKLFTAVKKNTKYEIRRAQEKDALAMQYFAEPSEKILSDFVLFYNEFAKQKARASIDLNFVKIYADAGYLCLANISKDDEALVWQAYLLINGRARLLLSASLFRDEDSAKRQLIGRANRLLHWLLVLEFKKLGASILDLGGWYAGSEDKAMLQINEFKESFGAYPVKEYNLVIAQTFLGALYLRVKKIIASLR